jgi:hypothetical protein
MVDAKVAGMVVTNRVETWYLPSLASEYHYYSKESELKEIVMLTFLLLL